MSDVLNEHSAELMHLTGWGVGKIEPSAQYSDAEVCNESMNNHEQIADWHIVCIDGRPSEGKNEPVRPKLAGGGAISGFMGLAYADWYMFGTLSKNDQSVFSQSRSMELFNYSSRTLSKSGVKLGGHISNHATSESTDCGANEKIKDGVANKCVADLGETELRPFVEIFAGDRFDEKRLKKVVKMAKYFDEIRFFDDWNSIEAAKTIAELGVLEVLSGEHLEQSAKVNKDKEKSNNRDHAKIQEFEFDVAASNKIEDAAGRNQEERDDILHGIAAYNGAIAYLLTKNQRVSQT